MPKGNRQPGVVDGTEAPSTPLSPSKTKKVTPKSGRKSSSKAKQLTRIFTDVSTAPLSSKKATPKAKESKSPKERKLVGKAPQNRIIVGVDFGTSNSGVAYVRSLMDAHDIRVILNWTGGVHNNEQMEKVPTRIAFASDNEDLEEDQWGYNVQAGAKSYTWFKLRLDRAAPHTKYDSPELSGKLRIGLLELPEDMGAVELSAKYLSKLYQHIMGELEKAYGASIVRVTPIEFWFTVPATWQDSSIAGTLFAAEEAGFGAREDDKVNTITEPEAAAISILSESIERNPGLIKVQSVVLVCDLGGGTLDFQLLTVVNLNPLQLEHTITGIGGKAGSAYIDCNFHKWLKNTFGDAFDRLPISKIGSASKLMNDWEVVKKSFNGKDLKKKSQIPLPSLGQALRARNSASDSYDFEDHSVVVTGEEIAEMFEPTIRKAFELIEQQLEALQKEGKSLNVMTLCGGLGGSDYVWKRFQAFNEERFAGRCELLHAERAWSAIARGAALRGLEGNKVLSRKAKRCYGIACHRVFREGIDKLEDRFWCDSKQQYRANGYISWPILVGKPFTENMRVETPFYIPKSDGEDEYTWTIYSYPSEKPPERVDSPDVKQKNLQVEGDILIRVPEIRSRKRLKKDDGARAIPDEEEDDDEENRGEKVNLVIKMGSERGTLAFEILYNRKAIGSTVVDYSKTHVRRAPIRSAGVI